MLMLPATFVKDKLMRAPELISVITCPRCGNKVQETMPEDSCVYFYECPGCGEVIKPVNGDCCVFCSYGTVPCPPVQLSGGSCCQP